MKTIGTIIIALILSCNLASAQDTLYIYRSGVVVSQRPVSEIDSITFNRNYNVPIPEITTDADGNVYHSLKIGNQTWMTENLKTTRYRNGDLIGTTSYLYNDLTYAASPKYQWAYDGNESNVAINGRLYTWHAVTDSRNIAPAGWHVATYSEWTTLQNYLIKNAYNYDKTTIENKIAKALSFTSLWYSSSIVGTPGNDMVHNNTVGFSVVPAGYRGFDGYFYTFGMLTDIWTSTEFSTTNAWIINVGYNVPSLNALDRNKNYGFSVRCIKDTKSLPTVITNQVTSITSNSAVTVGSITSDGGEIITERGVCWSTSPNPSISTIKISSGTGIGTFTCSITGLMPDSTYYVRAYATNSVGTAYGEQVSFKTLNASEQTVTDIDGNVYHTVKIGTQTWMVENLKTTKYRNGDSIPCITNNNTWAAISIPAYCWYNNDITNKASYGALYNWVTVIDNRNLAPVGWHIATDAEWSTLTNYLGGESEAGGKMKEAGINHWLSPNTNATNSSYFSGLPAGLRSYSNGTFRNLGSNGYFWSTTASDSLRAYDRELFYNQANCFRYNFDSKLYGFSVRCVKDSISNLKLPIFAISYVHNITDSTALCEGKINSDGGSKITASGVCWSTTPHPTLLNNKVIDTTGANLFAYKITGLMPETTYYARAYATNSVGTVYDEEVSFKTLNASKLTVADIDGNIYHTVKIGTQIWMVENLKVTKYNDNTAIPLVADKSSWASLSTPGYCWYNNDSTNSKKTIGALYNWFTVNTGKLAPKGWHIPTDAEWYTLTTFLGGDNIAGGKLKETGLINWTSPNTGATNETNFTAIPTGNRGNNDGTFQEMDKGGFWWTSTDVNGFYSYFRSIGYSSAGVGRSGSQRINGLAVRCVRDSLQMFALPTIALSYVYAITNSSASFGVKIGSDGGSTITQRGVCWSTSDNPTILNNKISVGTGIGVFDCSITGLLADSTYYVRAYAINSVGTAYGEKVSFKTLKSFEQTVTDIDGNIYHTIKIGNQTWMVENLKTTKYNDGSTIPNVTDGYAWSNLTTPGYCWYSNDLLNSKDTYGALYNWYTVNTAKLAPIGWHVPTQLEIDTLANHLGGYPLAGSLLKESGNTHWYAGNSDATNTSGFTALPGGYRSSITGDYHNSGMWGVFWSSTEVNDKGGRYILSNTSSAFEYNSDGKKCGFSVRCIKDSTTNSTLPSFVLSNISSITDSSAICTAKIGSDGGSPVTARGVCWSTSQNPTISDNKSYAGVGAGVYNCNIAGLSPNTTYYARAYATNSIGTAYDIQVSFTTLKNDSAVHVKWTVYNTSNSGLSNNSIFAVTIDNMNNKWIGSNLSTIMDKFNGSNWTNYTNDKISTVHGGNLVIDKKGDKWIVGEGLNRFKDSTWTNYNTVNSNLPDNYVYAVVVDSNNTKWIGTREAGLVKFNDSTWTIYNSSNSGIPNTKIYSLAIDKSGDIWIGTAYSGIVKFDGTNYTNYTSYNSPLPSNDIYAIAVDPNGNLWFGTYNGVAKFNGSVWTIYNTFNSGLSGNYIRSFGFTDDGSVWIGTVGNGLSRLKGNEWTVYNTSNSELPNDNVLSIAIEKNQNKIWMGTQGGGLASIEF